ncbi:MAG TPA: DUF3800 domain-containing protein [Pyrinomonadaceae bacterium]|jgi:hypothetical protein|nr:DUF3800 domain-containing protein [Pyrinomonadaceae bacterium]
MKRIAFADESGIGGNTSCYAIGVVSFDADCIEGFDDYFKSKLINHGVQGEAKWTKVRASHGLINFTLEALDSILRSQSGCFDVIVVNTSLYRNWRSPLTTKEDAFYKTYALLLRHIAERANLPAEIFIDDRSDTYAKRDEMMKTIGNNMLAQLATSGRLTGVRKVRSHDCIGVQVADLLTGAVNASHARFLNARTPLHSGKGLAIERLARMIGWDDLCYDTMPSNKFNIWHFPIEYRADPSSRPIQPISYVPYVTAADLLRGATRASSSPALLWKSA